VDERLVGFGLPGGHATELAQQLRGDANGDELFCVSRSGAADSAGGAQFGIGRFRNVGKVELVIRRRLGVHITVYTLIREGCKWERRDGERRCGRQADRTGDRGRELKRVELIGGVVGGSTVGI